MVGTGPFEPLVTESHLIGEPYEWRLKFNQQYELCASICWLSQQRNLDLAVGHDQRQFLVNQTSKWQTKITSENRIRTIILYECR